MRVESTYSGINHCLGRCYVCGEDWDDVDSSKVRRDARNHTLKTGHETTVEAASVSHYRRVD